MLLGVGAASLLAAGVVAGLGLYEHSETPEFCGSCHVMGQEHRDFLHNGAHRRFKCVDCHLPNDSLPIHLGWKGYEGIRDVFEFYGGVYPETVAITEHGKKTVRSNCVRCHEQMVSGLEIPPQRSCVDCHRRHTHKKTGGY